MRFAGFVVAAFAAIVAAGPLHGRAPKMVTVTHFVQVTQTYTAISGEITAEANSPYEFHDRQPNPKVIVTTTTTITPNAPAPEAPAAPAAPAPEPEPIREPAPQPQAQGGDFPSNYARRVVQHHNAHRANHSASGLVWDNALAATAQKIAETCVYQHVMDTDGGGYGQNIAAGAPADNVTSVISDLFYNGECGNFQHLYGQATPSNINNEEEFDAYGHFTQMIWLKTTAVGCSTVDCAGRGKGPKGLGNVGPNVAPVFTVCNYKAPGNFLGQFDKNVMQPLGHPTISWDAFY